jgi:uncharacterized protein (TIGR03546 family)
MITFIAKLLAALNANSRPGEIAGALSCGLFLALLPGGNLLWFLLFVLFFLLKIHIATMLFSLLLLTVPAQLTDPLLHWTGEKILTLNLFLPLFQKASDTPIIPFTAFNNTVVMGALIWGTVLWFPVFLAGKQLVKAYRARIAPKLADNRLVRGIQKIPLVRKLQGAMRKATTAWEVFKS